ncbi:MAG: TonB-dependent receptor [Woeseiaceae bacterium]|nr:TonB-dependent receptor [Woeseiaceae bacterium]
MRGTNPTILGRARLALPGAAAAAFLGIATFAGNSPAQAQDVSRMILEEIVVTAQRREENLQDVPISVSAMRGDRLSTIVEAGEDVRALANRIPALYAESSNGRLAPRFYMRGLGNSDFDLAASQSVSIIMDEVVQENVILKSFPLFDIERVEVLRGPQGTLFGRNTPAGIVKFDTRKPTEELNGYVSATVGTYGTMNVEGAVGGSLTADDRLLGRVSVLRQHRGDWISNGFTGEEDVMGGFQETAWRAQLLARPNDRLSALLNVHGRNLNDGTASIFRANIFDPGSNSLNDNFIRDTVFFDEGDNNPQEAQGFGASLKVDWELADNLTLTSISAHEGIENRSLGDIDGGFGASFLPFMGPGFIPFPAQTQDGIDDLEQITQEVRLSSDASNNLFWQAGVFYFKSDFNITTVPFFVPPTTVRHKNEAWAVFGQVAWDLSDRTTLTTGVRFTDDEKDMTTGATPNPQPPVNVGDEQVSWDISLMHDLSDSVSVYGRVANGFRAPSIQGRNIAFFDPNPFSIATSETILSTEIGFKSEINARTRINGAVYYYTIDDQQHTAIGGNTNSTVLVNADKGVGIGTDVDAEFLLSENFVLTIGGSYSDTKIDDSNLVTISPCQPESDPTRRCTLRDSVDSNGFAVVDGNPFPQAPEYQFSITARYGVPVRGDDELYIFADYAHQGNTNFFLYDSVEYRTGDIFEAGLRAGYIGNNGQWELAVFARNLTDEENLKGGIDFNNNTGFVNEPRIFGMNFRMNFGGF